ncbi:MAG TPA: sigma-54 dependent transcriptional regulator [Kiritimatiellia bacterium]|nr:sigma-54 dependent transcriptional regulator [Kiritimatiellia bacterium]
MKRLLIVDDEFGSRQSLQAVFNRDYEILLAENAREALEHLDRNRVDLAILDYMMPDIDGVSLLKDMQTRYADLPFIMVSASSTVRPVVDAIRAGAFDFVSKPFDVQEIRAVVARAIEHNDLKRKVTLLQNEVARSFPLNAIIGQSGVMRQALSVVDRAAQADATVMIHGESGTGKELIARRLHAMSARRDEPFIPVHCGSLPDTLMESELFGHERGAFTGAERQKPGRFDLAGSGTLFFDEVSEMSPATQVKLLRVLQEKEYMRVGGTQVLRTNARIIGASNKDLMTEVKEKRFREDLYYRLNVIPITLPPLRDRRDDIPLLASYFLQQFRMNLKVTAEEIAPDAMDLLIAYSWPGNVREMRNIIERAMVLHGHRRQLPPECLPPEFHNGRLVPERQPARVDPEGLPVGFTNLEEAVGEFERKLIQRALREAGGVQTRAAELLGTTRRILKYRIDKLNIPSASGADDEGAAVGEPIGLHI